MFAERNIGICFDNGPLFIIARDILFHAFVGFVDQSENVGRLVALAVFSHTKVQLKAHSDRKHC